MIFVFKTSVKSKREVERLAPHIAHALPNAKWNFDLQDIDNILRIDADEDIIDSITGLMRSYSHACEELD